HTVPFRVHAKDNHQAFATLGDRFEAHWTPTTLLVDTSGTERHRIEGFLPANEFLSQLALGVAKAAFARKDYAAAERLYRDVIDRFASTDAARDAALWNGALRDPPRNSP